MNLLQKHMVRMLKTIFSSSLFLQAGWNIVALKTCYIKVQKYPVSFIWWPADWPIRAWLPAHPASYFNQGINWYFWLLSCEYGLCTVWVEDPRAIGKTGLLMGAMQIYLLCASLGPGRVDLLDKIKGFLDHLLTAGHFYPDVIRDINHH